MAYSRPLSRDDFDIAITCALSLEAQAVHAVLDKSWDDDDNYVNVLGKSASDSNVYTTGAIGSHNVVIVYMPDMGTVNASRVAAKIGSSFRCITLALIVGVCGGVPETGSDSNRRALFLGDLVLSSSIVQYAHGRQYPSTFERRRDTPGQLNAEIRSFLSKLKIKHYQRKIKYEIVTCLRDMQTKKTAPDYPGREADQLFVSSFVHEHHPPTVCERCNSDSGLVCEDAYKTTCRDLRCAEHRDIVDRAPSTDDDVDNVVDGFHVPGLHIGPVGCADVVMKSASHRDSIAQQDGVIAFEMESAGVWDQLPSLVVKSVCDYADSHKNKEWQSYAAAVAAARTRAIIRAWNIRVDIHATSSGLSSYEVHAVNRMIDNMQNGTSLRAKTDFRAAITYRDMHARSDQLSLPVVPMESFKWIWSTDFPTWLSTPIGRSNLVYWVTGKAGSGKSTLMKYLADSSETKKHLSSTKQDYVILRFYFDFRAKKEDANTEYGIIKMFISQLCNFAEGDLESKLVERNVHDPIANASLERLIDWFCQILAFFKGNVCVFVDGLDEYEGNHVQLVQMLKQIQYRTQMKLCLASRLLVAFQDQLSGVSCLYLEEHNASSVRAYIDYALASASNDSIDISGIFNSEVRDRVVQEAQGVMVWARLAIDALVRGAHSASSPQSILQALDQFPEDLSDMYDRSFARLTGRDATEAAVPLYAIASSGGKVDIEFLLGLWYFHLSDIFDTSFVEMTIDQQAFSRRLLKLLGSFVDINDNFFTWYNEAVEALEWQRLRNIELGLPIRSVSFDKAYFPVTRHPPEVRLMHKSVRRYLQQPNLVRACLPQKFKFQQIHCSLTPICVDVIAAADDNTIIDLDFLRDKIEANAKIVNPTRNEWPGRDSCYTTLTSIVQSKVWEPRLRLLAECLLKFPSAAHADHDSAAYDFDTWNKVLRSPLLYLELRERLGAIPAAKMLTTYASQIDVRLAVEYGLSQYLQDALAKRNNLTSQLYNNLLFEAVRVMWEDGVMPVMINEYQRLQRQTRDLVLRRLQEVVFVIMLRCDAITFDLLCFAMSVQLWYYVRQFAERVRTTLALFQSLRSRPVIFYTDPLTVLCKCGRVGHPLKAWLFWHKRLRDTPGRELNMTSRLDLLLLQLACDHDSIGEEPCEEHGSAYHCLIRNRSYMTLGGVQANVSALMILAKIGADPSLTHLGRSPFEQLKAHSLSLTRWASTAIVRNRRFVSRLSAF